MDKLHLVTWQAGQISVHAASEKEAVQIAVEYLLAQQVIKAQDISQPPSVEVL